MFFPGALSALLNVVCQAQPALAFIPQAVDMRVVGAVQLLLPAWLRWAVGLKQIEVAHGEVLAELYQKFENKKVRFLIAFRHPCTDDPLCMAYLLGHGVPKAAKQAGIPLLKPVHGYFLYDRGIPLWAGSGVAWLFPKMGGSSIFRGKLDMPGLRAARDLLVNGDFPLAAAPEGATNDHGELVSPLEPGLAQLGFWAVEDLQAAGRDEEVYIVPVGIQYRYCQPPWAALQELMTQLELDAGLTPLTFSGVESEPGAQLYQSLLRVAEHLLTTMEDFYQQYYHQPMPKLELPPDEESQANSLLIARLQRLLETGLKVAESHFGIKSKGNFCDRCRRLEQAAWDRMYRDDLNQQSPLQRGLADWVAAEASWRLGHMRWVERFTAITGQYIREKPTPDRFAEILLILGRVTTWLKGGKGEKVKPIGPRRVKLTIGQPISVTERYPIYSQDRRQSRQAVTQLTDDLQIALKNLIEPT